MIRRTIQPLSEQIKEHLDIPIKQRPEYAGNDDVISTGSTLLDLAISGGRFRGGGVPLGIMVEIFGPSGAGKTVLLCELAGKIMDKTGNVMFHDPEARINKQFAMLFGLDMDKVTYAIPNTIPELFESVRNWNPDKNKPSAIFADSLAALSTDLEMTGKEGDKMGMRRAKEFSEELRKTCRIITQKNHLLVCSNQVRVNHDAGPYGQKYVSPGGEAIGFYSSLRLRVSKPTKGKETEKIAGKEVTRVTHTDVDIEVYKSSIWKPYRIAPLTIFFDYGIDDIRQNLKFIKTYTTNTLYSVNNEKLSNSVDEAIKIIEKENRELELREQVIDLWEEIEAKFKADRKMKR